MGFKRTTEGRVFFQSGQEQDGTQGNSRVSGPANGPANGLDQGHVSSFNPPNISAPNQMQLQILGLLKSLNERLRATQADRDYLRSELETYKGLVHDLKRRAETLEDKVTSKSGGDPKKSEEAEKLASEAMKELLETRKTLSELEDRTEKTESDLKRQVAQIRQNETIIRQKQTELEQLQQAHQAEITRRIEDRSRELSIGHTKQWEQLMARIEKRDQAISLRLSNAEDQAKTLNEKAEEALSNTSKLDRKVEKSMQERTRLIRKLERIEETVIQTHDALNARAMVLLTDQNTASQSHFPYKSALDKSMLGEELGVQGFVPGDDEAEAGKAAAASFDAPALSPIWWRRPLPLNAPAMSGIVVVALLAGWFISHVQQPALSVAGLSSLEPAAKIQAPEVKGEADAFLAPDGSAAPLSEPAEQAGSKPADTQDKTFEETMNKFTEQEDAPGPDASVVAKEAAKDDLGTKDLNAQDKILAALEDDPDALAAKLNEIEPGSAPSAVEGQIPMPKEQASNAATPAASSPDVGDAPKKESVKTKSIPLDQIAARVKSDPDLPASVKEIEAKAFAGSAEAQHDLAAIYTAGHGGVKQDYKRAALWFQIAAEGGVANAAYNLGVLYHQGIGVKQDLKTALGWYQKAADQGHPEAQYNLGIAHIEGVGLPYDPKKAARYFENAARAGVMEAAYNLGLIYENGLLGEAQPDEALEWYKAAADKGSPEAKAALEHLAKSLNIRVEDVNKLVDGMKTAKSGSAGGAAAQPSKTSVPAKASDPAAPAAAEDSNAVPLDPGPSPERTLTAGIQEQLMSFGLYPGPADGLNGPLTEDAVRSYQSAYGLEPDGKISQNLLSHMMAQSVKAMTDGLVGSKP